MLAKLINENEQYNVEVAWYNPHGIRESKKVPVDVPEETENTPIENTMFNPLLTTYYKNQENMLQGRTAFGNGRFYQISEVHLLLDALNRDAAHVPVYLACLFGLSLQEVLELKWSDINLDYNVLMVRNGMTMRMTKLCIEARDSLVAVLAWQKTQYRLAGNDGPANYAPVCLDENGTPFEAEELCCRLQAAIERAGLSPIAFDQLRFSSAMLLQDHGYSLPEIWSWLGQGNCYFNALPLTYCQWSDEV